MDGGEEAVDEVLVEVLVLAHGEDPLPLRVRHLLPDALRSDIITGHLPAPELEGEGRGGEGGREGKGRGGEGRRGEGRGREERRGEGRGGTCMGRGS